MVEMRKVPLDTESLRKRMRLPGKMQKLMTKKTGPENISIRHQNYSADWWTPPEWMDWVARTLGSPIDGVYDPCPTDWTPERLCGLESCWETVTYCNHPGSRGSGRRWWAKYLAEQERHAGRMRFVWCQFNIESIRHLRPHPGHLPGWLIWPRDRISFIWGGETIPAKYHQTGKRKGKLKTKERKHGEPAECPGNSAVFWTNVEPATPPTDCVILRTS